MDGDGVRMAKHTRRLAFALKTLEPFFIVAHVGRQHFERDQIAQQHMPRLIDRTHAALAEQRFDIILVVNFLAD